MKNIDVFIKKKRTNNEKSSETDIKISPKQENRNYVSI